MNLYRVAVCLFVFVIAQTSAFCAEFVYKKLPSGQVVIVRELKDNPIVTINTWVKTGSINENDANSGVAHFLEHLFFKGSKNVPTGEFDKILESKGAITNAATSKDYTQFYITIPSKDFDLALNMHSDMLLHPLIPKDELQSERAVVIEEISRGLDNPSNVLYTNLFTLLYSNSNHPYKRPVIGTKEIIFSISRDEILDFYNKWYVPSNMITVIVGDIDANYAIKKVQEAFNVQFKKQPSVDYPSISPIPKQAVVNEEKDVAQAYMAIAFKAPKFTGAKETYALDLLSVILGGSNSSVLNSDIKEKRMLVNSISAFYSQYLDDGLFIISSTMKPENLKTVQNLIFEDIEKLHSRGVLKSELERAKAIIKTSTEFSRESGANIAAELGSYTLYCASPDMYNNYLKKIDEVNIKDVESALNKFLINKNVAISTVVPKGFVEISNVAPAAKIKPDDANLVVSTDKEKKYVLANGSTLIFRKNKQNSIVAINIMARGGNFLEKIPAVGYFTAQNIKRGTENFSYEELTDFLDENGIRLSFSGAADAFDVSLMFSKSKLNEAFSVLEETVKRAKFPTSELNKTKHEYKMYANSLKDRPLSMALDEFSSLAFRGYPYSNSSKVVLLNIDKIQRENLIDFYDKIFDSKNLVISVVGDVDENKIIKELNKIFDDKKQKEVQVKDYLKTSYIPQKTETIKLLNSDKETTWILVGYKTPAIYSVKDVATLKVIDSLLGTGMSSRLFQNLREQKGLAYQVGSQINQYGNDGAIFGYIGTNSKNEKEALNGLVYEFNRLKTEFVPEKELNEAKEKLLGNIVLALETNMDRAAFLTKYETYGFDLDYLENLKKEILNVSQSDIISFSNRYFSNPHFEIVVGK